MAAFCALALQAFLYIRSRWNLFSPIQLHNAFRYLNTALQHSIWNQIIISISISITISKPKFSTHCNTTCTCYLGKTSFSPPPPRCFITKSFLLLKCIVTLNHKMWLMKSWIKVSVHWCVYNFAVQIYELFFTKWLLSRASGRGVGMGRGDSFFIGKQGKWTGVIE